MGDFERKRLKFHLTVRKCIAWYNAICTFIERGCSYLVILLMAAIVLIVSLGVFFRFVLNNSLSWTEEIAKYLLVWLSFIGSATALRKGTHIGITILSDTFKGKVKNIAEIFVSAAILTASYYLMYYGWRFAVNAKIQTAATIDLSLFWVMVCVPVSGVLMALFILGPLIHGFFDLFGSRLGVDFGQ